MKLVIAVIHDQDADPLFRSLAAAGMRATRIGSSGGYLRNANATVFVGVEDEQLRECIGIIERTCRRRLHRVSPDTVPEYADLELESIAPVQQGGGVFFVMPVERFVRIARPVFSELSR
jgi:uncharacterized protein YaaQ